MTREEMIKKFEQLFNCSVEDTLESPSWGPSASDNHNRSHSPAALYYKINGKWKNYKNMNIDPIIGGRYSNSGSCEYVTLSNPCVAFSGINEREINPFLDPDINIWGEFSLNGTIDGRAVEVSNTQIKKIKRDDNKNVILLIFQVNGEEYLFVSPKITEYELKYIYRVDKAQKNTNLKIKNKKMRSF